VFIGDQPLEQRFGRFPDIGDGRELRTEHGRAEVLLTPGVFLRIAENSSIRMLSSAFSDTRVELLGGTAILEANEPAADASVRLIRKNWEVKLPHEGVYRIDSEPSQVSVYEGAAEVSVAGEPETVAVRAGETLPLASVLVADKASEVSDDFKNWAMSRSEAISSDNATASGIVDDPTAIENSTDPLGGLSYFPLTGIPGLVVTNPYGASFWSPFQSALSSTYFSPYTYGLLYPAGWPTVFSSRLWRPTGTLSRPLGISSPLGIGRPLGVGGGLHPGGIALPGTHSAPPRPVISPSHPVVSPHVGVHPGVRR
jgi:hypothetical protein